MPVTQRLSQAGQVAGEAVVVALLALELGIAIYLLGSFALMGRHTSSRRFGSLLRAFLREAFVATITQPFLLLYYAIGRRMSRAKGTAPIVFVHGYMQNRVGFVFLARALARRGLGPTYGFNYPWFASLESNAARLERFVDAVCRETGSPKVDLVCHSMGGLVATEMMRSEAMRKDLKVRRCVTIATPHAGIAWRGPMIGVAAARIRRGSKLLQDLAGMKLAVPFLSIYSTHDNVVHPKETSSLVARGGHDVEVDGLAHLAILFSPAVADHVAAFLSSEQGKRGEQGEENEQGEQACKA